MIKSLKHRRQFLQLKETVTRICVEKYESNLLRKSFYGFQGYTSQKIQLKSLEKFLTQKHLNKTRVNVILALQLNVERAYQKKMDTNFLKKLHEANLKRRILLTMSSLARLRKDLRLRAQALQVQHQHATVRRHFEQMYLRFCKKNSDRRIAANLRRRREAVVQARLFERWLRRYRTITMCEQVLSQKVERAVCFDTFKLWRVRMIEEKEFRFKDRCFRERQRARWLRVYWDEFTSTIMEQKRDSEMNEAARWFFWKSKS